MATTWSWLFQNAELADVTLRVVAERQEEQQAVVQRQEGASALGSACGADDGPPSKKVKLEPSLPQGDPEVLLELPGHKQVLSCESEFLRARVLRWGEAVGAAVAQGPWGPVLQLQAPADAAECARQVLRYAYTRQLDLPDAQSLMTAARLADSWAMPACVAACLHTLSHSRAMIQQLQVPDINAMLSPALPAGLTGHAAYGALRQACVQRLQALFPKPHAVLSDDQQLAAFCSLCFPAVLQWLSRCQLVVDSENSVAALISWWWDANQGAVGDEEATQLTAHVRVLKLSRSYITLLEQLPWFKAPQKAIQAARFVYELCKAEDLNVRAAAAMPPAWSTGPRTQDKDAPVLEAKFTRAQLQNLHSTAATGSASLWRPSTVYYKGYKWHVGLGLNSQRAALRAVYRLASALPEAHGRAVLVGSSCELAWVVQGSAARAKVITNLDGLASPPGVITGTSSIFMVPRTEQPRAHSCPPNILWADGLLPVRLTPLQVQ